MDHRERTIDLNQRPPLLAPNCTPPLPGRLRSDGRHRGKPAGRGSCITVTLLRVTVFRRPGEPSALYSRVEWRIEGDRGSRTT